MEVKLGSCFFLNWFLIRKRKYDIKYITCFQKKGRKNELLTHLKRFSFFQLVPSDSVFLKAYYYCHYYCLKSVLLLKTLSKFQVFFETAGVRGRVILFLRAENFSSFCSFFCPHENIRKPVKGSRCLAVARKGWPASHSPSFLSFNKSIVK
ncbi:unnamed protein product [Trypanosoma congolense IL3000]|uniref:WGS project CAEQ00000000 data, annotated contig 1725 n=1 Tax=Trypanosoma congolense (strain IL3000) TaxID=1068625 RepID=F9W8B6_TRYCI|nr:unnamed protein product [Trypanosoma congolense IL3000]